MKRCKASLIFLIALLFSACQLPAAGAPEPTKPEPQAVFTSAAQTAEAMRLARAASTGAPVVEELIATAAAPTPTIPLPTQPLTPALPAATTAVPPTQGVSPAAGDEKAEFVEDVTIPDGTRVGPGKPFTKTWRLRNVGKTTWTTEYALVFIDGDLMGASPLVPLPSKVSPYEKVDISVDLIAPSNPGKYRGYWKLRNAQGQVFGVGPNADEAIWVEINAEKAAAFEDGTPVSGEPGLVSNLSLAVNNANVYGVCPHTFVFTVLFTLSAATPVTYSLEAGDSSGSLIRVPPPTTRNLDAGSHSLVYELSFVDAVDGWARLHITEPEEIFSNQVDFVLTC
ncbi:MAG: hypothetical protein JXA78_08590 [Anaerolineales bacterium]|nr:hypothetical protein [Anaerolineales bacterium]